jgi:DNA-binding NarL/FixJ family response regulator
MVVACTGHTEEEYIQKAWRHQIDEIVPKPVKADLINIILKELV